MPLCCQAQAAEYRDLIFSLQELQSASQQDEVAIEPVGPTVGQPTMMKVVHSGGVKVTSELHTRSTTIGKKAADEMVEVSAMQRTTTGNLRAKTADGWVTATSKDGKELLVAVEESAGMEPKHSTPDLSELEPEQAFATHIPPRSGSEPQLLPDAETSRAIQAKREELMGANKALLTREYAFLTSEPGTHPINGEKWFSIRRQVKPLVDQDTAESRAEAIDIIADAWHYSGQGNQRQMIDYGRDGGVEKDLMHKTNVSAKGHKASGVKVTGNHNKKEERGLMNRRHGASGR